MRRLADYFTEMAYNTISDELFISKQEDSRKCCQIVELLEEDGLSSYFITNKGVSRGIV